MTALIGFNHALRGSAYRAYVQTVLPTLKPDGIGVVDNLTVVLSAVVREAIR